MSNVVCPPKALVIDRENKHCGYYIALVDAEHTPDDVRSSKYFGRQISSSRLRVDDEITVRPRNRSYHMQLIVRAIIPETAEIITEEIHFVEFARGKDLPDGWEVKWLGDQGLHAILYDGKTVEAGFASEVHAHRRAKQLAPQVEERVQAAGGRRQAKNAKEPAVQDA